MKGNAKVITKLNARLAEELAAVNQYILHSEMCANWGYGKLHEVIEKRAIDEMKHAEMLIARILFLEGKPTVSKLAEIHVGDKVEAQFKNDLAAEHGAVKAYNDDIRGADDLGDAGTRDLLEKILNDEEDHVDWIEAQLDQVAQMGIENYLAEQRG